MARVVGLIGVTLALGAGGCGDEDQARRDKALQEQLHDIEVKVDELREKQAAAPVATSVPNAKPVAGVTASASAPTGLDRAGLPALLRDPNPRVRRGAALLISQFADPALKPAVIAVATDNLPPEMAATTILALSAYLDDPQSLQALKGLLAEKDYKQLRERVDVLAEVKTPALAPVLLEREKALELENWKNVDWDLVTARRSLVNVMGAQGNPVVVPRMLELLKLQSLAAQQAAQVLQNFRDDATIAPALAEILKDARLNPPAKVQTDYLSVYTALSVARKIAGPVALTKEMIEQLYNGDNNIRSLAFYGLRDWAYEKRGDLLVAEVLNPANETQVPNMKETRRWELAFRCLYEASQPETDLAMAQCLRSANPEVIDRALQGLRDHATPAGAGLIGAWLKAACGDPAFCGRDEAGQDFENAVVSINQAHLRGGFGLVAPVFDLANSAEFAKASSDAKKTAKLKNLETAEKTAVQILQSDGALSDCPALVAAYNKLPEGEVKKGLYDACTQVRWPITFSEDHKTVTLDQAKFDALMKNQQAIPKMKNEPDQF
ncbi:MAG TPA: HEAT repeat domain-containing protein [Planctomycetota bacterium]|nr:HEAT repeat domain-containing protein [Planctomycetota bacterium]